MYLRTCVDVLCITFRYINYFGSQDTVLVLDGCFMLLQLRSRQHLLINTINILIIILIIINIYYFNQYIFCFSVLYFCNFLHFRFWFQHIFLLFSIVFRFQKHFFAPCIKIPVGLKVPTCIFGIYFGAFNIFKLFSDYRTWIDGYTPQMIKTVPQLETII